MKFLVADDHELFLKGLELVLKGRYPQAQIVLAHNYGDIFKIIAATTDFDLILTDLAMPGDVWNNALRKINTRLPKTPIIILSAVFDKEIVQKTIEIGVSGYLSKTAAHTEILEAIDLVLSGGAYLPNDFLLSQDLGRGTPMDKVMSDIRENQVAQSDHIHLTPRQKAVLECMAAGKANKQIAYELNLSEGTVKLYVTAILKELNVYNRTSAVIEATKLGLINRKDEQ